MKKITINISFSSSKIGQLLDYDTLTCKSCPRGTFSKDFINSDLKFECSICYSDSRFYCYGINNISPKPGFWRPDSDSDCFLKCPTKACMGDSHFEESGIYSVFYGTLSEFTSRQPDIPYIRNPLEKVIVSTLIKDLYVVFVNQGSEKKISSFVFPVDIGFFFLKALSLYWLESFYLLFQLRKS